MNLALTSSQQDFINRLPKCETHLHLEGALPYRLLQGLDGEQFAQSPASWRAEHKYASFKEFEDELIGMALQWYNSPERYHEAAKAIFAHHQELNVQYVETSFHSGVIDFLGIPGPEILAAILEAVPSGLEVRVFMGMLREGNSQDLHKVLEESVTWPGLSGIDLHGPETPPITDWMVDLWAGARQEGKTVKAHAGEFGGPDNIRQVVERLGVKRVQHGVRVMEEPAMIPWLVEQEVTLDVCPISNVKLDVVAHADVHPFRALMEAGVACTVSTDDPLTFGNTLVDEYAMLINHAGFEEKEIKQVIAHGFDVALVDEQTKQQWKSDLAAVSYGS